MITSDQRDSMTPIATVRVVLADRVSPVSSRFFCVRRSLTTDRS